MDRPLAPTRFPIGPATAVWFGGLTGFVLGMVFELFRLNAEWQRVEAWMAEKALRRTQNDPLESIACFIRAPAFDITIPLLSSIVFAMVAVAIVFWLAQRPRLLLSVWAGFALLVLGSGYLLAVTSPKGWEIFDAALIGVIALLGYVMFRRHPHSVITAWLLAGITFVLVPASLSLALIFATLNLSEEQTPFRWLVCMVVAVLLSAGFGWLLKLYVNRQTEPISLQLT